MAINLDEQLFLVVEDFVTNDQAKYLLDYINENSYQDGPREHYKFVGLGQHLKNGEMAPWDPEDVVRKAANYAYNFFRVHYQLDDSFVLDRVFGNTMLENSLLHSHKDFSYDKDSAHDPNKKTFVAGLFLTDDYEGGETTFFESQTIAIKPPVGSLVLFTGHSVRHGVNQVLNGTRVNILYMFYYTDPVQD